MRNPYEVLGVSPLDSYDTVKRKYRELCKKYHPDVAGDESADKIKEIYEAWNCIKNSVSEDKVKQRWSHKTLFTIKRRNVQ